MIDATTKMLYLQTGNKFLYPSLLLLLSLYFQVKLVICDTTTVFKSTNGFCYVYAIGHSLTGWKLKVQEAEL